MYEPENYIDPNDFYKDLYPSWLSLIDPQGTPGDILEQVIKKFIWYKEPLLYQITTAYLFMSQKWCKVNPILFSYGLPGSGKSTLALIASFLHNQTHTFSPGDTFASVRNALDGMRWLDKERGLERDGALLAWDNIDSSTLSRDPRLYHLLLYGYNRQTDRIQIANQDGSGNKTYHVFCPKILSSVEALHLNNELGELNRRMLVIPHQKTENRLLSLQDYDWGEFPSLYFNFWHNPDNCQIYVSTKKHANNSSFWFMSESRKHLCLDLVTTHSCIYQLPVKQSIQLLVDYWAFSDAMNKQVNILEDELREFMTNRFIDLDRLKCKALKHSDVRDFLTRLEREGKCEKHEIKSHKHVLEKLGYRKVSEGWVKI